MHLQRNATQRNAYHHYILNNNFKFYIFQFFRAVNFLSAVFGFAKISSFIKESKSSYFFEWQKSKQKTISFFVALRTFGEKNKQKNNYSRITKSIRKNFFAVFGKSVIARLCRSNLYKLDCFTSFAMTIKNIFEIISRNENYAFNHNKNFCRNGNNRIGKSISHSPKASYGNEVLQKTEVIQFVWIATLTLAMTSSWFAGTVYFLAMIMAKSLFSVLGIILIAAFYLIEKF